jgi:hypothetical protein
MGIRLRRVAAILALCAGTAASAPADATEFVLSTNTGATLGGLPFNNGDLVLYDDVADTAVLVFSESEFAADENVDAVHFLANGNILLSTFDGATLGGLTFRDGDIVEYDPISDVATLFFDEDLFLGDVNVDAFSVLGNGNLVLSTTVDDTLAGLSFLDGDLVLYDPVGGTASLFLSEAVFGGVDEDIDGVHVFANGTIALSTETSAAIGGLGNVLNGDVALYDPVAGTATLIFDEASFGTNEDIDALYIGAVPEPGTGSLLALGLALLARRRRR